MRRSQRQACGLQETPSSSVCPLHDGFSREKLSFLRKRGIIPYFPDNGGACKQFSTRFVIFSVEPDRGAEADQFDYDKRQWV
jgi:hypothetical protein